MAAAPLVQRVARKQKGRAPSLEMRKMIERFVGDPGKRLLIQELQRQPISGGGLEMAQALAAIAQVELVARGTAAITQGEDDNDLLFILSGRLAVLVNGTPVAERQAGQHIGEMSLISPHARRSATAQALEDSIVARVSEPEFSAIAQRFPDLWRRVAVELSSRLRQRNRLVRQVNDRPHIFIGSSAEALEVARAIQDGLAYDPFVVRPWTDGVFGASQVTIEALESQAALVDFAVLVLRPDDVLELRGNRVAAPRDNVVFELGLFMGSLGRNRTFIVHPHGVDLHLPTDLLAVTPLTYGAYRDEGELKARMGPICNAVRSRIKLLGPR